MWLLIPLLSIETTRRSALVEWAVRVPIILADVISYSEIKSEAECPILRCRSNDFLDGCYRCVPWPLRCQIEEVGNFRWLITYDKKQRNREQKIKMDIRVGTSELDDLRLETCASEFAVLDLGLWSLDIGLWILDFGLWPWTFEKSVTKSDSDLAFRTELSHCATIASSSVLTPKLQNQNSTKKLCRFWARDAAFQNIVTLPRRRVTSVIKKFLTLNWY